MKVDNSTIKVIALIGFVCTITLGVHAFIIVMGLTFIFYLGRPSAYLGLLFVSGPVKYVPLIKSSPIDVTLLTYFLFILYFLFQRIKGITVNRNIVIVWIILGLCFVIIVASLITTPAPWSYLSKSGILIAVLYLPLVFMIVQLSLEQIQNNIQNLLQISMLIGYAWMGLGLHNDITGYSPLPSSSDYRFSAFGEDYMLFTLFAVPLVLEALIAFLFKKKYIINSVLLLLLTYCILNSPARGLTLSLIVAIMFVGWIFIYQPTIKKVFVFSSLIIIWTLSIFAYFRFFVTAQHTHATQRLSNYDLSGTSINNRFTSIKVAWEHWQQHVLFGTGTDSVAFFNNDPGLYTHNLILEIMFEYGLLGSIPLLTLVSISWVYFYVLAKNIFAERIDATSNSARYSLLSIKMWFAGMFIVLFLFAMTSGTLGTMRPLWILLALAIAFGVSLTTHSKTQSIIVKE